MSNIDDALNEALGLTQSIKQEILDPKPAPQTLPATVSDR